MRAGPFPDTIRELVDYLLFVDEEPLPAAVKGTSGFAEQFASQGPADSRGRSLRQLDLDHRLLKYPCSFLIYSAAFRALPDDVRGAIYDRVWDVPERDLRPDLTLDLEHFETKTLILQDDMEGKMRRTNNDAKEK